MSAQLPIIATTSLTRPKDSAALSSVWSSLIVVSTKGGGESRGCLSSELGVWLDIFHTGEKSMHMRGRSLDSRSMQLLENGGTYYCNRELSGSTELGFRVGSGDRAPILRVTIQSN